jgi:LysM repeat protein
VFDDEDLDKRSSRPADDLKRSEPLGLLGWSDPSTHERPYRQATRIGVPAPKTETPALRRIPNGSGQRHGPSHPDWETPPTPFAYPRLANRQARKTLWIPWPPVIAVVVLALIVIAAVVLLPLLGRAGSPSESPSPSATVDVVVTNPSANQGGSPSLGPSLGESSPPTVPAVTPAPTPTLVQYTVQSGDTLTRIATKFGIKTWQLLRANPALADNPNSLKPGMAINIPVPAGTSPTP